MRMTYHWRDGVGDKAGRKHIVNTNWGGVVEDNSFGTHEFMELCRQVGCEPYINGNMGSGTVQEMSEWVEYMTSDGAVAYERPAQGKRPARSPWHVKYFGVGNENWGCGGNMHRRLLRRRIPPLSDLPVTTTAITACTKSRAAPAPARKRPTMNGPKR